MKKKIEKKYFINSSEWSKTSVSIIEANQTQQTVILGFNEDSNLSEFALVVCTLSPLLGTPEKISEFFFSFSSLEIPANRKVYIIFSNDESENSIDEEQNFLVFRKSIYQFNLKDDEAVGLLRKTDEKDSWKLIDWTKPIIDEIIPLDLLKEASQKNNTTSSDFYKTKKIAKIETESHVSKNSTSFFEKPLIWLIVFILTISIFETASLLSLHDSIINIILKISSIFLKNIFTGFFLFKWIRTGFHFSISLIILLLLSLITLSCVYYLFSFGIIIGSALLLLFISIFSFLTRSSKIH
jgi:hypothetical protein